MGTKNFTSILDDFVAVPAKLLLLFLFCFSHAGVARLDIESNRFPKWLTQKVTFLHHKVAAWGFCAVVTLQGLVKSEAVTGKVTFFSSACFRKSAVGVAEPEWLVA